MQDDSTMSKGKKRKRIELDGTNDDDASPATVNRFMTQGVFKPFKVPHRIGGEQFVASVNVSPGMISRVMESFYFVELSV